MVDSLIYRDLSHDGTIIIKISYVFIVFIDGYIYIRVCVCVCVCVRARARVCVFMCVVCCNEVSMIRNMCVQIDSGQLRTIL